jgi:outer membrane protein
VRLPLLFLGLLLPFSVALAQEAQTESPPEPLSLDEATRLAFQNHGDVGAAQESLAAAAQRVTSAKSNRAPQLAGTIGTDYQNGRLFNSSIGGLSQNGTVSTTTTGVSVSQNLFDSGRTKYAVRSARAGAVSQLGGLGSARSGLAFEVAQRFFEQLRQQRLVSQRERQVEVAQTQLAQVEAQIEAGTSPRSDLASVRVTLSQAQFDLVTARNDLTVAVANLRNALGLERGGPLQLAYESPTTFEAETDLPAALALADERRPDLISARAQIAASEAAYRSARIEARPNVSASAGYNLDPREVDDRKFTFGATVAIPIFNGGGRRSEARAALDEKQAAEIRLVQAQRDVRTDVETALTNIAGQIERLKNARQLVESAQQNLETARGRYNENVGIALDVTVATSQLFEAQTSLASAEFDYQIARSNLDRATGRFAWENEVVPDTTATIEALR